MDEPPADTDEEPDQHEHDDGLGLAPIHAEPDRDRNPKIASTASQIARGARAAQVEPDAARSGERDGAEEAQHV